jgi:phenylacetate-CoA ligase
MNLRVSAQPVNSAAQNRPGYRDSFIKGIRTLIGKHADRVPEMSTRLAHAGFARGEFPDAASLSRVPILRKSALRDVQASIPPWGGMLADGFQPEACFMSPGGIVEPLVPRMTERLSEMLRSAGFGAMHTVLNGFGYHFTPAGLLFHSALVRAGCVALPAGPQNTAMQIEFASAVKANAFVGIASHLKILLDQEPSLSIRLAMAGAEPHGESIRADLLEQHGVRCVDMYGFAEAGILAVTCSQAQALHLHADVMAEVVDPVSSELLADGAIGELVVSLDNPGFPLLRFATGDLVAIEPRACACQRFGILQLLGRTDQSVRVKGMLLHQSQLQRFVSRVGASACHLEVSRVDDRDRIVLKIRPSGGNADIVLLESEFRDVCRLRPDQIEIDDLLGVDDCSIADLRVK